MKDKFKKLTASQKYAVTQGLFGVATSTIDSREDRTTNAFAAFDQTGATKANDAELEAMEQFERVWKMPDEDFEDENLEASHGQLSSTAMPNGLDSMSTVDPDGHAMMKRGKDGAAMDSAIRGVTFSQDCSTTRETSTLSANGALLASPDSKGVSVYEDQESKEASTEDPSRIEWFLNSCDDTSSGSPLFFLPRCAYRSFLMYQSFWAKTDNPAQIVLAAIIILRTTNNIVGSS